MKKSRAPLKSGKTFLVRIHDEINISTDVTAQSNKILTCSNGCETDHFFNKIFQVVKNKIAFSVIIEYQFAKNWRNNNFLRLSKPTSLELARLLV